MDPVPGQQPAGSTSEVNYLESGVQFDSPTCCPGSVAPAWLLGNQRPHVGTDWPQDLSTKHLGKKQGPGNSVAYLGRRKAGNASFAYLHRPALKSSLDPTLSDQEKRLLLAALVQNHEQMKARKLEQKEQETVDSR